MQGYWSCSLERTWWQAWLLPSEPACWTLDPLGRWAANQGLWHLPWVPRHHLDPCCHLCLVQGPSFPHPSPSFLPSKINRGCVHCTVTPGGVLLLELLRHILRLLALLLQRSTAGLYTVQGPLAASSSLNFFVTDQPQVLGPQAASTPSLCFTSCSRTQEASDSPLLEGRKT